MLVGSIKLIQESRINHFEFLSKCEGSSIPQKWNPRKTRGIEIPHSIGGRNPTSFFKLTSNLSSNVGSYSKKSPNGSFIASILIKLVDNMYVIITMQLVLHCFV